MVTVRHWTGHEATALRTASRLSVRDFAAHLGISARTISNWEARGKEISPLPEMQAVLDTALTQAPNDVRERFGFGLNQPNPVTTTVTPATPAAFSEADHSLPEAWELVNALTRSNLSVEALEHLERAAQSYAEQYPSTPPRALLASVSRQMTQVKDALNQPQRLMVRQRCVVLLGVLSGLAGNLWFDLGHDDRAIGFFDVGELAGGEANDGDLMAWLLATRSIVPFFAGRYGEATDLLSRAEEASTVSSSARRRAWVTSFRARAAAAHGDREQSLAALDRSENHISKVSEPQSGTDFFDAPRLEGVSGSAYMLMSDTERAVPLLSRALDRRSVKDAKGRALLMLDLAQCHATAREPEEAARFASEALEAAQGTLVGPIMARTQVMRAGLDNWADLRAVRNLDTRVRELTRGH